MTVTYMPSFTICRVIVIDFPTRHRLHCGKVNISPQLVQSYQWCMTTGRARVSLSIVVCSTMNTRNHCSQHEHDMQCLYRYTGNKRNKIPRATEHKQKFSIHPDLVFIETFQWLSSATRPICTLLHCQLYCTAPGVWHGRL